MYRLLIVDDEAHVVEKLAETVPWERLNIHEVFKAYSGQEAMRVMENNPIDIVILDISMPGVNGLELLRKIGRQNRRTKTILLSGYGKFEYAKEALLEGAADYLLKPASTEEILAAVQRAIERLKREWEQVVSQQRTLAALKENLPHLRSMLLYDLIKGVHWPEDRLRERMELLELSRFAGRPFALMLVRQDEGMYRYDRWDLSLIEYAIGNIAEEIFRHDFFLWRCTDDFKFSVFLVAPADAECLGRKRAVERLAAELHEKVRMYLNETISLLVSDWGVFPQDVAAVYSRAHLAFRRSIGEAGDIFIITSEEGRPAEKDAMRSLYLSPPLHELLEVGHWEEAGKRIAAIFDELEQKFGDSPYHIREVYLNLYLAITHVAQKNNYALFNYTRDDLLLADGGMKADEVREWAEHKIRQLQEEMNSETRHYRTAMVQRIRSHIHEQIRNAVTLQSIADHFHMHPSYISKIFKMETNENLSVYVMRCKMEESARLLKETQLKIYEIAAELGYQETHSFIYAFKKYFKMTPMEYRQKIVAGGLENGENRGRDISFQSISTDQTV